MGEAGVENPGVETVPELRRRRTQRWLGRLHRRAHGPYGAHVSLCKTLEMEEIPQSSPVSVFGDLDPLASGLAGRLAEQNEAEASEHP